MDDKSPRILPSVNFFIVVNPGFERLALYELLRVLKRFDEENLAQGLAETPFVLHSGGIELALPLAVGLSLNQYLRIPTRILLRLGVQKELLLYQDFQKWLRTLKIDKYFPLKQIYVSTRTSKLKMKDKLKKVFTNTYPFAAHPEGTDLYIRFFRDECTVSVDTSGEDLYFRGGEKWTGEAPLRDNMAAALLQFSTQGLENFEDWQLVDPMMGSGTFLVEGLQLSSPLLRKFSYQNWFKGTIPLLSPSQDSQSFQSVWGADLSEKNVEMAQKNLKTFQKAKLQLRKEDLFLGEKQESHLRRLVMINPPYGKRLKIKIEDFYTKVIDQIIARFAPERVGFLIPRGASFRKPQAYEQVRYLEFSNNSIDVSFYLLLRTP